MFGALLKLRREHLHHEREAVTYVYGLVRTKLVVSHLRRFSHANRVNLCPIVGRTWLFGSRPKKECSSIGRKINNHGELLGPSVISKSQKQTTLK